jgi:uncharacterized protein (DUF1778 family)
MIEFRLKRSKASDFSLRHKIRVYDYSRKLLLPIWHHYDMSDQEEMIMETAQVKNNGMADDRITARVPHSTRRIIERAAAVYGATISQFVVQASVERANEVLHRMEMVKLSSRDAQIFIDSLTRPTVPNKKLQEAVRAHKRLVEFRD